MTMDDGVHVKGFGTSYFAALIPSKSKHNHSTFVSKHLKSQIATILVESIGSTKHFLGIPIVV